MRASWSDQMHQIEYSEMVDDRNKFRTSGNLQDESNQSTETGTIQRNHQSTLTLAQTRSLRSWPIWDQVGVSHVQYDVSMKMKRLSPSDTSLNM